MSNVRVENRTDSFVCLPPLEGIEALDADGEPTGELIDFPSGVKLTPGGLTTVPQLYLDALHAPECAVYDHMGQPRKDRAGQPMKRFPGREALATLTEPVTYTTASGRRYGPRVTIHEDALEGRADGPQAPATLPSNVNAALAIIGACSDKAAVQRWLRASKDPNVKAALQARLAALGQQVAA